MVLLEILCYALLTWVLLLVFTVIVATLIALVGGIVTAIKEAKEDG